MKPFKPEKLPLSCIDWERQISFISQAHNLLGKYEGMLQTIVNPNLFLSPLTTQEAVLSSKIEGTQATLDEVLRYEANPKMTLSPEKNADIQEILNYRKAISYAVERLKSIPLSLNLIKDVHSILMNSVRGMNKTPGEFRKVQNYIGPPGADISQATYIPPSPEEVMPAMDNLEKYIHYEEKDTIVQLAIIKAQFEIIHPFLDGNGRIGRILIPLFLFYKNIISKPVFYLSTYLEKHRDEYYQHLNNVTAKNDWNGWISFFLKAVIEQAKMNIEKAGAIQNLYDQMKITIPEITGSKYSMQLTEALFISPLFSINGLSIASMIPKATIIRIVNILKNKKIVIEIQKSRGPMPGLFMFKALYNIVK